MDFDLHYISDSLWNLKSEQPDRAAAFNRVRGTVDIDRWMALNPIPTKGYLGHAPSPGLQLMAGQREIRPSAGTCLVWITAPSELASANTGVPLETREPT